MDFERTNCEASLSTRSEAHDRLIALNETIGANQVALLQRIADTWPTDDNEAEHYIRHVERGASDQQAYQ